MIPACPGTVWTPTLQPLRPRLIFRVRPYGQLADHGVPIDVTGRVALCNLVGAGTAETFGNGLHSPGFGLRKQPANGGLADAQGAGDHALVRRLHGRANVPDVVEAAQLAARTGTAGVGNGVLGAGNRHVQTSFYITHVITVITNVIRTNFTTSGGSPAGTRTCR